MKRQKYVSGKEAREQLMISKARICQLCKSGKLDCMRPARDLIVSQASIDLYAATRTNGRPPGSKNN